MDQIILAHDIKSKNSKQLLKKMEVLTAKYKRSGLNKENIHGLLATLMMEVSTIKKLKGHEKKEIVIDLMYNIIEQIEEGDEDTEFETMLKSLVPHMIDGFSMLVKSTKACSCFSSR